MTFTSSSAQCLPGHTATITCHIMRPAEPTNPSRAPRTLPRTHIPPNPYHDPSIKYAPARRPHDFMATQHTPRPRPIPNSLRLPLCFCRSNFELVFGMTTTFLECIALMDLTFGFWKRNLGSATTAMRYTLHGLSTTLYSPPIPFVDPFFSSATILWFYVACCSHARRPEPNTIEMEWRESSLPFSVVVIFLQPPYLYFY